MSITVIVLAILLIILLYILYLYLSPTNTSLITTASLSASNIPPITKIDSPRSPRYAYGLWIYVNAWTNTSDYKYIFSRNNNIRLYLDKSQLNLYLDIYMNNDKWLSDPTNGGSAILITNNFPIQKWCCIVTSVDGAFIDCYLDGKLTLSQKALFTIRNSNVGTINVSPNQPPDIATGSDGANIILGGDSGRSTPFDASVNNFTRWSTPVNPQIVWNNYINGNGTNLGILPKLSSYNAKLNIMKNNAEYTSFSLF